MTRSMTVTQLSRYIKGVFEDEELLHDVTLSGEIAEVSYSDKHTFITLSDGEHSIRCIRFFARDNVQKGVRIALHGSVRFYDKRNNVTFAYDSYAAIGDGDKSIKLTELKEKLRELGYFENRPQLPKYILDVVAITSPEGAAIRDFIRVVSEKNPFVRIRIFPVKVQGEGAAAQMARAVERVNRMNVDAAVLCRGGGSDEDLDSFNDETLATAVARSHIPIISAVGHEVDYTLCDFCAGTRAGTPSIAGEIVNAHATAVLADIRQLLVRARNALNKKLEVRQSTVALMGAKLSRAAANAVKRRENTVKNFARRGYYALKYKLERRYSAVKSIAVTMRSNAAIMHERKCSRVQKLSAILNALDPERIIKAGYAVALSDKKRVRGISDVQAGDELKLIFSDGTATVAVTEVTPNAE